MKLLLLLIFSISLFACQSQNNDAKLNQSKQLESKILNIDSTLIFKSFYPSGKTKQIVLKKDSLIDTNIICRELHMEYYENGTLKEKGCQGDYEGMGTSVGTWYLYDSLTNLVSKTIYHLGDFENAYKEEKLYYKNSKLKAEKKFKNDVLYEIEADSIGLWKFYSETGKLIDSVRFSN